MLLETDNVNNPVAIQGHHFLPNFFLHQSQMTKSQFLTKVLAYVVSFMIVV